MLADQLWVAGVFLATIAALVFTDKKPSLIFAMTMLALMATGQQQLAQVTSNLSNPGLLTLILLLLVSQAVDKTTLIKRVARKLVVRSYKLSFWRLFALTFTSSALLNNTAIVASLLGPVKQNQYHTPSRLLLPLSYAAILGGTVTLIGTSTNLIVDSFLQEQGHPGFAFFDFTLYGLTAGLCCGLFMYFLHPLLPRLGEDSADFTHYLIETEVEADSELIGRSVEENHLRNLPELFLVELVRDNQLITPVSPDMRIQQGDKLIFSGNIKRMDSLSHIKGLKLFAESQGLLRNNLTEVIVSNRAQIIGQTLKVLGFRALFDAAVVAIRRDGETLSGKLGDIRLQAGDFLLLATGPDFAKRHNIMKNFFVVSEQKIATKLATKQEWLTLAGFLLAIILAAGNILSLATSLIFLLALLLVSGALSSGEIKRNLPLNLMMVIVGALSLASAMQQSGLIEQVSQWLFAHLTHQDIFMALVVVYLTTLVLTEVVTNNAAAALMFPFAYGLVETLNAPIMPFALAVAFAASASFISPYGYQTNLLVYSASRYRYKHFIKFGLPISLCYSAIVLLLLKYNYGL